MEKEFVEVIRFYNLEECEMYFGNKKYVSLEELKEANFNAIFNAIFNATPKKKYKKRGETK